MTAKPGQAGPHAAYTRAMFACRDRAKAHYRAADAAPPRSPARSLALALAAEAMECERAIAARSGVAPPPGPGAWTRERRRRAAMESRDAG